MTGGPYGWWAGVPIATASLTVVAALLLAGLVPLRGIAIIPIAGILTGGAMTATSLAGRRFNDDLRARRGEVEAALALGLLPRDARLLVCRPAASQALAVAMDYTARGFRYPTPGLGRSPESAYPTAAEHLAERYRQLFVIALGELILVTALTLSGSGFAADRTAAFVVSFVGTALFLRIYIYRSGELLPAAIAAAPHPDRLAVSALTAHLLMMAGIVATAVGDELVIAHPLGHTAGLGRRHPRRARAVPGRAFLLRVRGVQPRVPGPGDRAARVDCPDTADAPPAAAAGRHRRHRGPHRDRHRRRSTRPRTPT
ncbi:hypothetical protein F8274_03005 [Micromonospora sp. AMSO31t]|nr:hypothetical protein F8274_03005 [Micromonospora sp. AMSO31t]